MLVALFRILSFLPLPFLHICGSLIGRIVFHASPTYGERLQQNLRGAGFGDLLSHAVSETGKNVMELPFVWCASPKRVLRLAQLENWDVAEQALAQKKGVIFLTPHLGCFEIVAQIIAARTPLTALYRPPRKRFLQPLIEGARARNNLKLAPANLSGVRTMAKALKRGESVGLLPDQVPQQGEGVWADFFDRPAYTMTLPAKLQAMAGAPIVLTYAERLAAGKGFVVRFFLFNETLSGSVAAQAAQINRAMENLIKQCPAQYFWSYNRYKVPKGVTPFDAKDASEESSTA